MSRKPTSLVAAARQPALVPAANDGTAPSSATGRKGKAMIGGWFDKAVAKQLRVTAAVQDTTQQNILAEALNDWFRKNGLPALARIEREDAT